MLRNGVPERFMGFRHLGCLREMLLTLFFLREMLGIDFPWREIPKLVFVRPSEEWWRFDNGIWRFRPEM